MSPRIEPVPAARAPWWVRLLYRMTARMVGRVPVPMAVMAHHPQILRGYTGYEWFLHRAQRVPARLKALAGLKAAARVGCPF
jgi:hypothetical protein